MLVFGNASALLHHFILPMKNSNRTPAATIMKKMLENQYNKELEWTEMSRKRDDDTRTSQILKVNAWET